MSSLISAVAWVQRGAAAQHPSKYNLDEKELQRVSALARIELEDARVELERASKAAGMMGKGAEGEEADDDALWEDEADDEEDGMDVDDSMDIDSEAPPPKKSADDLDQYNLDTYDDEPVGSSSGPFTNIRGLTYYKDNDEDPYITLKEEDEDDEREELEVLPTDNLLVIAKTEDDISQLEVYVYDESQDNLYVHHDLMLPSFPLCLEWLDYAPSSSPSSSDPSLPGNYIAVGTFDPEIEIWSLDTVDALYPDAILGRPDKTREHIPVPSGTGKKKKKKDKPRKATTAHHVDAVLSLSWNRTHRNLIASASADKTVKVWDLSRDCSGDGEGGGAISSFDLHKDKVQGVQWNATRPDILLTGSYDRTVRVLDTRTRDPCVGAVVGSDVEALRWDPWDSHSFYVSLENGLVVNFDERVLPSNLDLPSPSRFTLSAHDGAVSALDVNPHIRGCIATGGTDKIVKVWNIDDNGSTKRDVSLVTSRDLGVGKVFSVTWSPNDPLTVAAAGSKAKLQIWEVGANMGVRKAFKKKLAQAGREIREKESGSGGVIGVVDDDEDQSGDEAE